MKRCTRCGEMKPLEAFYGMGASLDGRKSECKACHDLRPRCRSYDRERHKARKRERRRRNRAQENAAKRRHYQRHAARYNARSRERYAANPLSVGRRHPRTARPYVAVLLSDPCSYCGARCEVIDHIEPVSRGGVGAWENLTAACKSCNSRKWAKPLLLFLLNVG